MSETNVPRADAETERERTDGSPNRNGRFVLESRRQRLAAYLRHNGERICRDVLVLGGWALITTIWLHAFGLPRWVCYAATFAGVVWYTRVTSPWSRPYASPDDLEAGRSRHPSQESKQRDE